MRTLLVTGGCGFIGSHFLHYILQAHIDLRVINLDALTYAGNPANVHDLEQHPRYRFVRGDICDAELADSLMADAWGVINFAAETHVDRSLQEAGVFLRTNVEGVGALLAAAHRKRLSRFLQVSTDEVYGDVPPPQRSREGDRMAPNSPYAAAKAGAELLCQAYAASYGVPVVITRGANTIGPRQHPEKAVPLFITNALLEEPLPIYGDGLQVRDWLDVEDHCRALDLVLHEGRPGEVYNIAAGSEVTNIELARALLDCCGRPQSLLRRVADRPGHDRRYAMDATKLHSLGWQPRYTWQQAVQRTVDWYRANPNWWQRARSDAFDTYYEQQYGQRLAASSAMLESAVPGSGMAKGGLHEAD